MILTGRGLLSPYFCDIFDGVCKFYADVDVDVKHAAQQLDKYLKRTVEEHSTHFELRQFVYLLCSRIQVRNPFIRQLVLEWIRALHPLPSYPLLRELPTVISSLFPLLADPNRDIRHMADMRLTEILTELKRAPPSLTNAAIESVVDTIASFCTSTSSDPFMRLTALIWLLQFLEIKRMLPQHLALLQQPTPNGGTSNNSTSAFNNMSSNKQSPSSPLNPSSTPQPPPSESPALPSEETPFLSGLSLAPCILSAVLSCIDDHEEELSKIALSAHSSMLRDLLPTRGLSPAVIQGAEQFLLTINQTIVPSSTPSNVNNNHNNNVMHASSSSTPKPTSRSPPNNATLSNKFPVGTSLLPHSSSLPNMTAPSLGLSQQHNPLLLLDSKIICMASISILLVVVTSLSNALPPLMLRDALDESSILQLSAIQHQQQHASAGGEKEKPLLDAASPPAVPSIPPAVILQGDSSLQIASNGVTDTSSSPSSCFSSSSVEADFLRLFLIEIVQSRLSPKTAPLLVFPSAPSLSLTRELQQIEQPFVIVNTLQSLLNNNSSAANIAQNPATFPSSASASILDNLQADASRNPPLGMNNSPQQISSSLLPTSSSFSNINNALLNNNPKQQQQSEPTPLSPGLLQSLRKHLANTLLTLFEQSNEVPIANIAAAMGGAKEVLDPPTPFNSANETANRQLPSAGDNTLSMMSSLQQQQQQNPLNSNNMNNNNSVINANNQAMNQLTVSSAFLSNLNAPLQALSSRDPLMAYTANPKTATVGGATSKNNTMYQKALNITNPNASSSLSHFRKYLNPPTITNSNHSTHLIDSSGVNNPSADLSAPFRNPIFHNDPFTSAQQQQSANNNNNLLYNNPSLLRAKQSSSPPADLHASSYDTPPDRFPVHAQQQPFSSNNKQASAMPTFMDANLPSPVRQNESLSQLPPVAENQMEGPNALNDAAYSPLNPANNNCNINNPAYSDLNAALSGVHQQPLLPQNGLGAAQTLERFQQQNLGGSASNYAQPGSSTANPSALGSGSNNPAAGGLTNASGSNNQQQSSQQGTMASSSSPSTNALTIIACLQWCSLLHSTFPRLVSPSLSTLIPILTLLVRHSLPRVALAALQVLGQLASHSPMLREKVVLSILTTFKSDRVVLSSRGRSIIRHICTQTDPIEFYSLAAGILQHEPPTELTEILVDQFAWVLLTAKETTPIRDRILKGDLNERHRILETLLSAWILSPVAAVGLCLWSGEFRLSYSILTKYLHSVDIGLGFLVRIDQLVHLLEAPCYVRVRMQLTQPHPPPFLLETLSCLLMVLPQASAFSVLQQRLQSASLVSGLHKQQLGNNLELQGDHKLEDDTRDVVLEQTICEKLDKLLNQFVFVTGSVPPRTSTSRKMGVNQGLEQEI
eukprot:GDKJ01058285.1.p1 GENE.GDKJ01058285.1~~GDKJ01058285.1.p1  ORF type:complete len:1503 (+),score=465.17 GDKJ01058285.1:348-4511(+)